MICLKLTMNNTFNIRCYFYADLNFIVDWLSLNPVCEMDIRHLNIKYILFFRTIYVCLHFRTHLHFPKWPTIPSFEYKIIHQIVKKKQNYYSDISIFLVVDSNTVYHSYPLADNLQKRITQQTSMNSKHRKTHSSSMKWAKQTIRLSLI